MFVQSTIAFCKSGKIPPPQTNTIKIPEAFSVNLPKPSTARLNIPPHITEVHRPINTKRAALRGTCSNPIKAASPVKTGILTVSEAGENIAARVSTKPAEDTVVNIDLAETLLAITAPTKRPTNISNQ